ncbi:MAG: hypothetical protein V1915_03970 [Candidatus Bathyarchaeota archaeon]
MKTLILIPVMYNEEELKKILPSIPQDFESVSLEYWSYIEEKLTPLKNNIYIIFVEKSTPIKGEHKVAVLLRNFHEGCKEFRCIDNDMLVAETESWLELLKNDPNIAVRELLAENIRERDSYAGHVINQTLVDGKIGILFLNPARQVPFPESIRVIRMCRFDPIDYLNRHLAKLNTKKHDSH